MGSNPAERSKGFPAERFPAEGLPTAGFSAAGLSAAGSSPAGLPAAAGAGDGSPVGSGLEFAYLVRRLREPSGFDLGPYKSEQVERRARQWMERRGIRSVAML